MAQSGSALDWGSSGRRFKSCRPDHFGVNASEHLMILCWLYSMSGLLIGISIYFGILLQIFIPTLSVLEAVTGLIRTLGDEGFFNLSTIQIIYNSI